LERFRDVLLDVWREACRHIEIRESASNIAALLAREFPLACLLVRRLGVQQQCLETVAVGQPLPGPFFAAARMPLTPAKQKRLIVWANEGQIVRGERAKRSGDLA